jgi:hypothetical protein
MTNMVDFVRPVTAEKLRERVHLLLIGLRRKPRTRGSCTSPNHIRGPLSQTSTVTCGNVTIQIVRKRLPRCQASDRREEGVIL